MRVCLRECIFWHEKAVDLRVRCRRAGVKAWNGSRQLGKPLTGTTPYMLSGALAAACQCRGLPIREHDMRCLSNRFGRDWVASKAEMPFNDFVIQYE